MAGKQVFSTTRGTALRHMATLRAGGLLSALLPLAVILAVRPFGNPLEQALRGQPGSALRYLLLAALWVGIAHAFGAAGVARRIPFYSILFGILLYAERLNFGLVSLTAAIVWSVAVCLAAVLELIAIRAMAGSGRAALTRAFSVLYQFTLMSAPLIIVAYNRSVGVALDLDSLLTLFQTHVAEARAFAGEYIDSGYVLALLLLPLLLLLVNWRQPVVRPQFRALLLTALGAVLILAAIHVTPQLAAPRLASLVRDGFVTYRQELAEMRAVRARRAIGEESIAAVKPGPPETFVIVIGESQNPHHMGAYGYFRNTTPRLRALSADEGLLLFQRAYASHSHTDRTLSLALTQASQRNDRKHYESPSLIDVANRAGFATYWITNQVSVGGWDNVVTAMAEASDHYIGLNRYFGRTTRTSVYDGSTVDVLRRVAREMDGERSHLVFIHLMGSHVRYCDRFPAAFATFSGAAPFMFGNAAASDGFADRIDCYDNSILYTDHVLAELLDAARSLVNFAGFLYFVDHGQDVARGRGHNSALFDYDMARIPMYAWFPESWRQANADRFTRLGERRSAIFTNDLIHDTMIGIMGIETPHYDVTSDLGAAEFDLSVENARTLHGARQLAGDPLIRMQTFTHGLPPGRIAAHRVNSLGKLADAGRAGFSGVEVDLLFRVAEPRHFELGHDEEHPTGGDLGAFLAAAAGHGFTRFWLDIKNLDTANHQYALAELERLAALHPGFRQSAIVESGTTDAWFADYAARGWHTSYYLPTSRILEAIRASDPRVRTRLAESIARQTVTQRVAAVSFDARLYAFVRDYLQPRLEPGIVYHLWDLDFNAQDPDARQLLEATPYYRDARVRTILVGFHSEYSI